MHRRTVESTNMLQLLTCCCSETIYTTLTLLRTAAQLNKLISSTIARSASSLWCLPERDRASLYDCAEVCNRIPYRRAGEDAVNRFKPLICPLLHNKGIDLTHACVTGTFIGNGSSTVILTSTREGPTKPSACRNAASKAAT